MSWITPILSATGDLITAALYSINYHDLRYLKGLDGTIVLNSPMAFSSGQTFPIDCTHKSGSSTRTIDAVYQNTSGTVRLALVALRLPSMSSVWARSSLSSQANQIIGEYGNWTDVYMAMTAFLVIKPGYFYRLSTETGAPFIDNWWEFDLGT